MRLKRELYPTEQEAVIQKVITILDLENKDTYTLHELDHNEEIQQQLMELIPEIRRWFSCNNMKFAKEPEQARRPWLSIIKQLLKTKYKIESRELQFKYNEKWMKTQKYQFEKI